MGQRNAYKCGVTRQPMRSQLSPLSMWVPGTEFRSDLKASIFTCWAISPTQAIFLPLLLLLCGGQKSMSGLLFYPSPHYFLRQSLSLNLGLIDSVILASQWALGIHLSLSSQHWDWKHVLPRLDVIFLPMGIGDQTWVLRLAWQAFHCLSYFISPARENLQMHF